MVNFKEIYHFSRFQRGSNIFRGGGGGSNFFQGGSNCLLPIETHITGDFPGGGVRTPCLPLWIRTCGTVSISHKIEGVSSGELPVYNTISFTKIKTNILS